MFIFVRLQNFVSFKIKLSKYTMSKAACLQQRNIKSKNILQKQSNGIKSILSEKFKFLS